MTVSPVIHLHRESSNPRHAGYCDCGVRLAGGRVRRDRKFEDEATRYLTSALKVDPEPLNTLAGHRADRAEFEYGRDFPSLERSLEREALEELADARNYIVWRLDAINRGITDDAWRVEHLQPALQYVALAFEKVRLALA